MSGCCGNSLVISLSSDIIGTGNSWFLGLHTGLPSAISSYTWVRSMSLCSTKACFSVKMYTLCRIKGCSRGCSMSWCTSWANYGDVQHIVSRVLCWSLGVTLKVEASFSWWFSNLAYLSMKLIGGFWTQPLLSCLACHKLSAVGVRNGNGNAIHFKLISIENTHLFIQINFEFIYWIFYACTFATSKIK